MRYVFAFIAGSMYSLLVVGGVWTVGSGWIG